MKKIALIFLSATLFFTNCKKETSKDILTVQEETLPASFTKRVLLEDYTKHCQFCIPVNSMVDSMKNAYPNRTLIPVLISAFHATQISYFDSINTVFNISSFPKGAVNRVPALNSGPETGDLVYSKENWASNIDTELQKSTDYGLKMESKLEGNSMNLDISIGSFAANQDLKLSVFIIEDDAYYRTVKRVLTNYKGMPFETEENDIRKAIFISVNMSEYNISKTSVVAFLHYFDEATQNYEVVNAQEVNVGSNVNW